METTFLFPDASHMVKSKNRQILHIIDEAIEVSYANTPEARLVELYDIIHATESLIRYCGYTQEQCDKAILNVVSKNAKRGYYEGCD